MGRVAILCAGAFVLVVLAGFSGSAYAITTFARMYNKKCEACHSIVPKLNEYGVVFMAKGFVLPEQEKPKSKDSAKEEVTATAKSTGKEKGPEQGGEESGAATKEPGADSPNNARTEPAPPAVEPQPTVVYKVPTRDGSVYFTDNPERKGRLVTHQEPESDGNAVESGRTLPSFRKKQAVPPPLQERRTMVKSRETHGEKPERYRNYAECMERQLDGTSQPESAQEMMDLFVTAEKKCAPYQSGKR